MIQDIAPHKLHNEYRPQRPDRQSIIIYYREREVMVRREEGKIVFPRFAELEEVYQGIYDQYIYLFTIDEERFYLIKDIEISLVKPYEWENINIFRTASPKYLGFAEALGYQLYTWYNHHKFCGRCGGQMKADEKERMLQCNDCSLTEYPMISPAVIVGVTNGDSILMSKYAGREYTNYALLAGFTEVGESVEHTVRREVMEEVGLKVRNITYYKSQPWPFTNCLLLGFFAELDGSPEITLDEEELAMADWFPRDEIPVEPDGISLTNEMMMAFKNGEI